MSNVVRRAAAKVLSFFTRKKPKSAADAPRQTVTGADIPEVLDERTLYLAGEGGELWFAALRCPCGCGDTIHLSLLTSDRPSWSLEFARKGLASLHPSIWRRHGCRSHFWFVDGRVNWVLRRDPPKKRR